MIGTTVSHYRIVELLGEGGMGVVYKAEDLKLQRTVALKFLTPALTRDSEAKERFVQEARATSALDHPSICTIHDIDETPEGRLFICMALYEGETLDDRIRRGALPVEEAVSIARRTAEGLAKAHGGGVVHRDIKPANLFITTDGQVKILDFGLAKLGATSRLTRAGATAGTAAYMSPEQARGEDVDGRTDVWSLGVVLYEMLSGRLPFRSDYEQALVYSVLHEDPEPLAGLRAGLPPELLAIAALREVESPGSGGGAASEAALPAAAARLRSRRRWILVVGGVLVLAALALVVGRIPSWIARGPSRPMLAVLPLENRGPSEDEYFADGITDAITVRLAGVHGVGVISRQSAMQYKRTTKTVHEIGEELGAHYILEGTIQRERPSDPRSRLRIIPNLIRVKDDSSVWADTYDEDMTELFRVQSEIAERVARALDITLLEPERRSMHARPTENLEAYEYFLRGGEAYNRRLTEQDSRNAITMYGKAVALDPSFAEAWAALARARVWLKWNYGHDAELAKAEEALNEALRLAPDLPATQLASGEFYYYGSRDFDKALEHFTTVQRGQPSAVEAISAIGWIRRRQGDWAGAVSYLQMALELNPRDPTLNHSLGQTLTHLGRYAEAETYVDRSVALVPDMAYPYIAKVLLYLAWDGKPDRARVVLEDAITRVPASEFLGPTPLFLFRVLPEVFEPVCRNMRLDSPGVDTASDSAYCLLYKAEMCDVRGHASECRARADSAREVIERTLRRQPGTAYLHGLLGLALADMGEKEASVREGETALRLLPVSKDAVSGSYRIEELAQILVKAGERERAIDQLELLLSMPSRITPSLLTLDPLWAPLREDPRFRRQIEGFRPRS
jgi:non-specific serine/threonine protein kinase